jgi:predicted acyltransferase
MIIVNTPGNDATSFPALRHAIWNGFTPTDLVFPSFVFVMGNALSFGMNRLRQQSTGAALGKIFKRTFIIFLLGYLMYWVPFFKIDDVTGKMISFPISETRVFGVLQRLALAYFATSLLVYFCKTRTVIIISALILIIYWPLMYYGGTAPNPYGLQDNLVLKIDKWLLGDAHLYHGESVNGVPFAFDPEGLLSTFPTIVNCVAGYLTGVFIQKKGKSYEGMLRIMLMGFLLIALSFFWNYVFPYNKKIWTSSFVLLTVGIDLCILATIVYVVDIKQFIKSAWFFEVIGKNPLTIYLLSELLTIPFDMIKVQPGVSLWSWLFNDIFSLASPYIGSFLQAIAYMMVCWSVAYFMDKKKIYIRA